MNSQKCISPLLLTMTFLGFLFTESATDNRQGIDEKYIMNISPNYTERNDVIMEILKENAFIEVYRSSILLENKEEEELFFSQKMVDLPGNSYTCDLNPSSRSESSDKSEASPMGILDLFSGTCATIHEGWWSYKWCHRDRVTQFHQDTVTDKVDPNWLLGVFEYTEMPMTEVGEGEDQEPTPFSIVDHFTNGQWCDETQAPRSVRVVYECCSFPKKRSRKSPQENLAFSIKEDSLCNYTVTVCSPALCFKPKEEASALSLLEELRGTCIHRHEGWWSYEFCFLKHFKQYHLETVIEKAPESGQQMQVTKMQDEYSLGKITSKQLKNITDAKNIIVMPEGSRIPGIFQMEYEGGTVCDLTKQKRSTTVQLKCGPEEKILSIVEDHTCHYILIITVPILCRHPLLGESQKPSTVVYCKKDNFDNDNEGQTATATEIASEMSIE